MSAIPVPELPELPQVEVRDGRSLATAPWGHQKIAIDFLKRTLHGPWPVQGRPAPDGGGALLAMWMGTGKSLLGVSMAANLRIDNCLIVCPPRVIDVWPEQFAAHLAPELQHRFRIVPLSNRLSVADRTEEAKAAAALAKARGQRLVVITNYEAIWRKPLSEWVLSQTWGLVILDEIHRIKDHNGVTSKFAVHLRDHAIYRLGLTGTPLPHSPLDIFAQARFINSDVLGVNFNRFQTAFAVMGGYLGRQVIDFKNREQLEACMNKFMFRVGQDVLDLPGETRSNEYCDLEDGGRKTYDALEREFVAEVKGGIVTAANAMVKILRLQQVTGGTVTTEEGQAVIVDHSKFHLLIDTLKDLEDDEPVVVFCRFRPDLSAVHQAAQHLGRKSLELSGTANHLERWKAGEAPILAVQIQSGGEGIDLTRARYSIYYSLSHSLGQYEQSLARIERPGQTRSVFQIHLIAKGTVDERIMRALAKRREVVQSILAEIQGANEQ